MGMHDFGVVQRRQIMLLETLAQITAKVQEVLAEYGVTTTDLAMPEDPETMLGAFVRRRMLLGIGVAVRGYGRGKSIKVELQDIDLTKERLRELTVSVARVLANHGVAFRNAQAFSEIHWSLRQFIRRLGYQCSANLLDRVSAPTAWQQYLIRFHPDLYKRTIGIRIP
jgi:hypothetical protein